eukprot:s2619_g8.t1
MIIGGKYISAGGSSGRSPVEQRVAYGDNTAAIAILTNPDRSWRMRHLTLRANFLREKLKEGRWLIRHLPGVQLIADFLAKVISVAAQWNRFWDFVNKELRVDISRDHAGEEHQGGGSQGVKTVPEIEVRAVAEPLQGLEQENKVTQGRGDPEGESAGCPPEIWEDAVKCLRALLVPPMEGLGSELKRAGTKESGQSQWLDPDMDRGDTSDGVVNVETNDSDGMARFRAASARTWRRSDVDGKGVGEEGSFGLGQGGLKVSIVSCGRSHVEGWVSCDQAPQCGSALSNGMTMMPRINRN